MGEAILTLLLVRVLFRTVKRLLARRPGAGAIGAAAAAKSP
jgi:hypothetical protein